MQRLKKNILLLACLFLIAWMTVGYMGGGLLLSGTTAADAGAAARSSMSATPAGFDYMESANAARISYSGQETLRFQFFRPGLFLATKVTVTLLTFVIICLKLFQAVNLPFNLSRITTFIHEKDGMK